MKTGIVAMVAGALALAACQEAPADGTSETPAPRETSSRSPTGIAVPAEPAPSATPTAPGAPKLGYAGPIPTPVRIGIDGPQYDACASYGEVTGLNPRGDNYLSVRDAPSAETKERDRIEPGQGLAICAQENGWYGVIYSRDDEEDCGTGSPVETPRNYTGPCRQGWVSKKFVTILAG